MKKNILFLISAMIVLAFTSGCTKVVTQSNVYEFSITFSNVAGKQTVTEGYTGLKDKFNSSDAILVYVYFGNTSGEDVWMPMPATVNTASYEYAYTDSGVLILNADAGDGNVWTTDFSLKYRVIQIPRTALVSKSMIEIDNTDYNAVMKEFDLYEVPVVRK